MLRKKKKRALICYAGSAPEASIGSKPIGSELKLNIGSETLISQEFSTPNCRTLGIPNNPKNEQTIVFNHVFEILKEHRSTS